MNRTTRPSLGPAALLPLLLAAACTRAPEGPRVPANRYVITVHYELGMHCSAFDLSYCCVLPPYNSVLSQVVETASAPGELPRLLSGPDLAERGLVLAYEHDLNTHSEGEKLLYWNVPADVNRNGSLSDPIDSFVNEEWKHLHTYLERPFHEKPAGAVRKARIGLDLPIRLDSGITGKPVSGGVMDWSGPGGTLVYTVSNDGVSEVPIPLGMRDYFEALALPLTPFFDGSVPFLRAITEETIRPYQSARVTIGTFDDRNRNGLVEAGELAPERQRDGRAASFFGTNPIDVPACDRCHASDRANGSEYGLWKEELDFWQRRLHGTSPYFARTKAAAVSMLEIHDKKHGTDFLAKYDPADPTGATITRLGRTPVRCQDCHGDNVLGVLDASPPREERRVSPLSAAIHRMHLEKAPQGDRFDRPANCQTCHPGHWQSGRLDKLPMDAQGEFTGGPTGDVREAWGGCFLGRDVHSNPGKADVMRTRPHLNAVGTWLQKTVFSEGKGLYCTHCHNLGSRLLYKWDELDDALAQTGMPILTGPTLRNQSLEAIVGAFRSMEKGRYADWSVEDFFDPKVGPPGSPKNPAAAPWTDPINPGYAEIDDGGDYWLSAGEPHCADCHVPPFVEGIGGTYAPIDSERKYSLMRFSKGHHGVSCQSCHQSTHGLFPVADNGPDPTSFAQAKQYSPDGNPGPVSCVACHAVDSDGVPTLMADALLAAFPDAEYPTRYEKAVAYAHTARLPKERATPSATQPPGAGSDAEREK